ncbi:unnamed protein product, partial [Symbiodinium sp. KB8]
ICNLEEAIDKSNSSKWAIKQYLVDTNVDVTASKNSKKAMLGFTAQIKEAK